jgi:hypothetical protein
MMFSRTTFPFAIRSKNKKMRKKGRNSLIKQQLQIITLSCGLNFTLRVDLDQFAKIQPSSPKTKFSLRS